MNTDPKRIVLRACRAMLRPIVRILLRNGVIWKEFAEASKAVYVDVAGADYGIAGRQTNASRVSILTGLTRREVKKQRDLLAGEEQPTDHSSNVTRLLSGWHQDADFQDQAGRPALLVRHGDGPSFDSLHQRHGGDIPAVAMLKELIGTGVVGETEDGRLRALSRYYMPSPQDPEAVIRAGSVINDLGTTVGWNLARESDIGSRFEGRATETRIPLHHAAAFCDFLEDEGQAFLERVDAWLTSHRSGKENESRTTRMGVGVYTIRDDSD